MIGTGVRKLDVKSWFCLLANHVALSKSHHLLELHSLHLLSENNVPVI